MADGVSTPVMGDYLIMPDHIEVQALRSLVKEMSIASLSLRSLINTMHHQNPNELPREHETTLRCKLDYFYRTASKIPERVDRLVKKQNFMLDTILKDRDAAKRAKHAAVETLEATTVYLVATDAKERALEANAKVLNDTMTMFMKIMSEMRGVVWIREKPVIGRERKAVNLEQGKVLGKPPRIAAGGEDEPTTRIVTRERGSCTGLGETLCIAAKDELLRGRKREPVKSTEEQATENVNLGRDAAEAAAAAAASEVENSSIPNDVLRTAAEGEPGSARVPTVIEPDEAQALRELSFGADAAMEDAEEAVAAVARINRNATSRTIIQSTVAAAGEGKYHFLGTKKKCNTPFSDKDRYHLRKRVLVAYAKRLRDREVIVSSREKHLDEREATIIYREEFLEARKVPCHIHSEGEGAGRHVAAEASHGWRPGQTPAEKENFRALIELKDTVERTQAKARRLLQDTSIIDGADCGYEGRALGGH